MQSLAKISDVLSKDELNALRQKSDLKALATLVWNWGLIVAAFAIAIIWPNPLTILVGIMLLGGRQLVLGIINHIELDSNHSDSSLWLFLFFSFSCSLCTSGKSHVSKTHLSDIKSLGLDTHLSHILPNCI